jgi:hypothetical protein
MHGGMMNGRYGAPFAFAALASGGLLLGAVCTAPGGIALGVAVAVIFNVYSSDGWR